LVVHATLLTSFQFLRKERGCRVRTGTEENPNRLRPFPSRCRPQANGAEEVRWSWCACEEAKGAHHLHILLASRLTRLRLTVIPINPAALIFFSLIVALASEHGYKGIELRGTPQYDEMYHSFGRPSRYQTICGGNILLQRYSIVFREPSRQGEDCPTKLILAPERL